MDAQPIRPSRWWYGVAALILVAGTGLSVGAIVRIILRMNSGLERMVVPGTAEIVLKERGSYQVYYEHNSVIGDRVFMTGEDYPGLECQLVARGSKAKISMTPSSGTTTYELGGHAGKAILDFQIDQPGKYIFSARYPSGRAGPDIVLAVGHGTVAGMVLGVFGAIAGLFASFVLAVVVAVVTIVKRSRARNISRDASSHLPSPGTLA